MILHNINGKNVIATPTGIKVGSKGKVTKPKEFLKLLPKNERRKIRKQARSKGLLHIATA